MGVALFVGFAIAVGLVADEWGTFTSFSGSDGAPASFATSNKELPAFVYNGLHKQGDTRHWVLVGRHDFLTPEQETAAEQLIQREQKLQAELYGLQENWGRIGRFAANARQIAEKRLAKEEATGR